MLKSFLSRLFGGGGGGDAGRPATEGDPVEYKGYRIIPAPVPEGSQFRLAARIEGEVDGETKVHQLVRADLLGDRDAACEAAVHKARQVIDEQGARLFD